MVATTKEFALERQAQHLPPILLVRLETQSHDTRSRQTLLMYTSPSDER